MDTINQRLIQVMEHFNLSPSSFAAKLDINRSSMSHIVSSRNKPGLEIIQKLLSAFPAINSLWLLIGSGEMLEGNARIIERPSLFKNEAERNTEKANQETKPKKELDLLDTIKNVYTELEKKNNLSEATIPKSVKRITLYYDNGSFEDFYSESK